MSGSSRQIRICHVALALETGGLERLLADLARLHNRSVFKLSFVTMRGMGRFAHEIQQIGCPVHQLQRPTRFGKILELALWFRRHAFDIVHTHNAYPHINATPAARVTGVPVIINTQHGPRMEGGQTARWQHSLASLCINRIVAVSDDLARLCAKRDKFSARKVIRIWNGIDLHAFPFAGPSRKPIGISVGRLSPEKDLRTLLRATKHLLRWVPTFRLIVVGDGPSMAELRQIASDLGITERVDFVGERTDVAALLSHAGFFVSSSRLEGISLTILEAMATGLPVIATCVGGSPEIVEDGRTGWLVPSGDPVALAQAMRHMCNCQDKWDAMGKRARQRVKQCFDVVRMVGQYEELYLTQLKAKR